MNRRINQAGLDLIKQFEGLRLTAYLDPAGVWTIGYGSTGAHVTPGMRIASRDAEALLRGDLIRSEVAVEVATDDVPTTDNQFAAMVSLAYNIGGGAFRKSSVLRFHRAGATTAAGLSFLLFNKAKGRILGGLVRRRNAERGLYLS